MRCLQTGEPINDVLMGVHKPDQSVSWIRINARPIVAPNSDEPTAVITTFRDVTEARRLRRRGQEFIGTVSHELRTPLTAILGSLELIENGVAGDLPDRAYTMVGVAVRNGKRLLRLVEDLLDVEKTTSGDLQLERERLSVPKLIEAALRLNTPYAERHNTSFELGEGEGEAFVEADENRVLQVITNLLSNAAKFSPGGTTVRMEWAVVNDNAVRISVHDQGPGVPQEFQERVFDKFTQADASDSRAAGGTGLGLAISKALVEAHGGRIGFSSREPQGSTFFFELPVAG